MQHATFRRAVYIGFTAALLILAVITFMSYNNTKDFLATSNNISSTNEVVEDIDTVGTLLSNIENQSLLYIITGDSSYRMVRHATATCLRDEVAEIRDSVSRNPAQLHNLDMLEAVLYHMPSLQNLAGVPISPSGGSNRYLTPYLQTGHTVIDSATLILSSMENIQRQLLLDKQAAINEGSIKARNALQYGTAIIFVLLFLTFIYFRRDMIRTAADAKTLASANDELEKRIQRRTAELQRTNEKLKEQYILNETLLQAVNDVGIGISITQGAEFIYANNALAKIFGLTPEELKALPSFFSFIIPKERERLMARLPGNTLAGENFSSTDETIIERRNGEQINIEYTAKGVRVGEQIYTFSTVRNITDRKEEENKLRKSQANLAEAQRIAHVGSWELDLSDLENVKENSIYVSDEVIRLFGFPLGEAVPTQTQFQERIHPEDREKRDKSLSDCLADGRPHSVDYRIIHRDGTIRIVHAEGRLFFDEKTNRPLRLVGSMQDITERMEMQKQLHQYYEQIKGIVENIDIALLSIDTANNQTIFVSPACEDIYGYPPQAFYDDPLLWKKVRHPEDVKAIEAAEKLLANGSPIDDEYRIVRSDGSTRWVYGKWKPIVDSRGNVVRIDGYVNDITKRKLTEEHIRASLREKEILLKEIHHRVKNNMQIMSSMINLQEDFIHEERDKEMFRSTQNRIKSMALVHEMLYQSDDLAEIDFGRYIQTIVQQLFDAYGSHPEKITFELQTNGVHLGVDTAIPCGLIINELVSNSLKYAFPDDAGGAISIVFTGSASGGYQCTVSDTGVGLPKDIDIKHTSTLGLQLVDTLVRQIGGTVEIVREQGTTFRFTFTGAKYRNELPAN